MAKNKTILSYTLFVIAFVCLSCNSGNGKGNGNSDSYVEQQYQDCAYCNGTGKTSVDCDNCDGGGYILRKCDRCLGKKIKPRQTFEYIYVATY